MLQGINRQSSLLQKAARKMFLKKLLGFWRDGDSSEGTRKGNWFRLNQMLFDSIHNASFH